MCTLLSSLLHNLLQRLGLGHAPTPVHAGQEVWLLDNTAYRSPRNPTQWQAEFVAAYFTKNSGKDVARVVADIAEKLGLAGENADEETERRIAERVMPFLNMILSAKTVDIRFSDGGDGGGGAGTLTLGPSNNGGVSADELVLPGSGWVDDQVVVFEAVLAAGAHSHMKTAFADPEGWGVISDIDDTIKVSEVRDRTALLRHTFADLPEAVPGMPDLYSHIQSTLHKPVWFYLSASPYNLYPMLRSFTSSVFPRGQIILRTMSWMEFESFLVSLTVGTQEYKEERMRRVLGWLPRRKWVLVGDSTQKDPEAYATTYKAHPNKVKAIYIRRVSGVNPSVEKSLNSTARFEKAFKGVPKGVWKVFDDPAELKASIDLLSRGV